MPSSKSRQFPFFLFLLPLLAACSESPSGPAVKAPTISISGVTEGTTYPAPVTINISVDRGTYTATLNDAVYTSGQPVSQPGSYTLAVSARDGSATSNALVHFTVTGSNTAGVTIIRLINLGPNDSGGGGDAILITDSTAGVARSALVDAGPAGVGGSDFNYVFNRIKQLGIDSLDFVMLSHAHGDHYLGLTAVLNGEKVKRFYYNGQVRTLSSYQDVLSTARARVGNANIIIPSTLQSYTLGPDSSATVFTIVPPLATYLSQNTDDGTMINEGSIGMQLRRGAFDMFFTGDGEVEATARWRTQFPSLTTNLSVLKVGHHGANNAIFDNGFSGTSSWLAQTNPQASVISANGTTHPRLNALNALLSRSNMKTYCTNVHGEIVIRVSGGNFTVTPEKNAQSVCVAGSQATT